MGLRENETLSGIGAVDVQQTAFVFAILAVRARPFAGISVVVDVQKMRVCCDFQLAHAALCGDRRGQCAKTVDF